MWIANVDSSKERCRVLGVTGSDDSPALEVQEGVFDQMTPFITLP